MQNRPDKRQAVPDILHIADCRQFGKQRGLADPLQ